MLQRHNITGSEVKTRGQNVPGYGAMHGAGPRLHRPQKRWIGPTLIVIAILAAVALVGFLMVR
jgi:hypothetical protein